MNRNLDQYQLIKQSDYESAAGPDWPSFDNFLAGRGVETFVYDEVDSMLLGHVKSYDNFCILPFYGIEYPKNNHCCLLPEKYDIDQIKQDMLSNRRTLACQNCWTLEDRGLKSDRQLKNDFLTTHTNRHIKDIVDECVAGKNSTVHFKFATSNTCNATCITCNSAVSTAWGKLTKKSSDLKVKSVRKNNGYMDARVDYSTAEYVTFTGGESFLNDLNFYTLEKLLAHGNDTCYISFVTNGSIQPTKRQLEIIKQFKNLNFCVSIDGVGPVFEYLRYPLSWDAVTTHIKSWQDQDIAVSASYTVSNLNILYHDQTTNWLRQHDLEYILNPVYHPAYFNVTALPKNVKEQICSETENSEIKQFLSTHTETDDTNYMIFRKEMQYQDRLKQINMQDYLPELTKLLG